MALPIAVLALSGCTGVLTGTDERETPGDNVAVDTLGPGGAEETPGEHAAGFPGWGPALLGDASATTRLNPQLLTRSQYEHTIALVFAESLGSDVGSFHPASGFPSETRAKSGFEVVGAVSDVHVARHLDAAAQVVDRLKPSLDEVLGCAIDATADEADCLLSFLQTTGELLYRRPLNSDELTQHLAFYEHERDVIGRTKADAAGALIQMMLCSPYFLYRWELGHQPAAQDGDALRLNAFQVASRLSFFLWNSGPDAALLAAAKNGQLETEGQVAQYARAMLDDPRAAQGTQSFIEQWLEIGRISDLFKDPSRFPQWSPALAAAMQDEVRAFTAKTILGDGGDLSALFSADEAFVNETLAPVYGLSGVVGEELRAVPLPEGARAGLLTMPGVLASASDASVPNPFRLGKLLLEKVFCEELEPPPDLPEFTKPESARSDSERKYLEELTSLSGCQSCHVRLNPLGFGLGDFDAIGAVRAVDEHGYPIEASGVLPNGDAFSGPGELGQALARSDQVRACMTKQWFRYATGALEEESDHASLGSAYNQFEEGGYSISELLVGLVTTRSFLFRAIEEGETVP